MNLLIIVPVVALKYVLPLLYARFPFVAGWANFVLDSIDGDLLIPAGLSDAVYQPLDKAADWVTYLCIFLWGRSKPIRREIIATFALRTVGQALFFATNNEFLLFCFPNLLEPLFLVYVTIARFRGWDRVHDIYRRRLVWIWVGILLYKFKDEYFTHVSNTDRTELLSGLLG